MILCILSPTKTEKNKFEFKISKQKKTRIKNEEQSLNVSDEGSLLLVRTQQKVIKNHFFQFGILMSIIVHQIKPQILNKEKRFLATN
jgi:hypothetical protein